MVRTTGQNGSTGSGGPTDGDGDLVSITIVVPCYNEAGRWSHEYWQEVLALPGIRWLFVDDGSTDGTGELLEALASGGDTAVLRLHPNGGKAEAVRKGMLAALSDSARDIEAVGYMDADGAFNASDVRDMTAVFGDRVSRGGRYEAVWSSRVALAGRNIRRSMSRHYIGRIVATVVSLGQDEIPYDTQSGLKLFAPRDALRACLAKPFRTRWLFELELLTRWQSEAGSEMRIWEEPLNYWHDVPGSKIRGREAVRVVGEIVIVKREQSAARRTAR
jgi:glycosyltransferase involved in cell wall biosynthesis